MKLQFSAEPLWDLIRKMGAVEREFVLERSAAEPLPPIVTSVKGIDVTIDDVDTVYGLLSSNGAQVVLYIPDQGRNIDLVLVNGKDGRRVHVADCITLDEMRQKNRFQRYRAVVNITGDFDVFGFSQSTQSALEGNARLQVCINCLKHLNYHGYVTEPRLQREIWRNFNLKDFFAEHSTLFRYLPSSFVERKEGYADNWISVSEKFRASKDFTCQECLVELKQHRHLLHTHHVDGNKRNNQTDNLMALCADCHRKQPLHDFMSIKAKEMAKLQSLRREQGILGNTSDWADLFKLIDPPFQGLLRFYKANGTAKPEIGYEITDATGMVIAEAEIAWPKAKFAVLADNSQRIILENLGWKVETLDTALQQFRKAS